MRKFLALVLLAVVLIVTPARAQSNLHFSSVEVDVWPEYDQPSVLVIYHLTLAPDIPLPATLSLRVPSGVQVGKINDEPQSERTLDGKWVVLTIKTTSSQFQIEYYTDLIKTGIQRHITYEWPGDYDVNLLEVNFLQPVGARNVTINPPSQISPGNLGLTNHRILISNITAGQTFSLEAKYDRTANDLSIAGNPISALTPPGPNTPGSVSVTGILPWVLGALGILLVIVGIVGFFIWQAGNRASAVRQQSRLHAQAESEIICPQCGKRAQTGDAFCRTCGTRLEREAAE